MPRYFFDIEGDHKVIDRDGRELSDDARALAEAELIAQELAKEKPEFDGSLVIARTQNGVIAGRAEICVAPCDIGLAARRALHNKAP